MAHSSLRSGIALFNQGRYFDAHEVLEELWRVARGRRRRLLQALIQIAVGLHHHSRGNLAGARSLLARGGNTLAEYPASYAGLRLGPLQASVTAWREALAAGRSAPPLPRLAFTSRARRGGRASPPTMPGNRG